MSDESEYIFFTYDDAAKRLGIKPDSVRRRASARRWPKKMGNDALARVGIPKSILPIIPDVPPAPTPDVTDDIRIELASVKAQLSGLKDRLADAQREHERLADLLSKALEARPIPIGLWQRLFGQ